MAGASCNPAILQVLANVFGCSVYVSSSGPYTAAIGTDFVLFMDPNALIKANWCDLLPRGAIVQHIAPNDPNQVYIRKIVGVA